MNALRANFAAVLLSTAFILSACASGGSDQTKLADSVTRAIYANDISDVTTNFASSLVPQVTRASVGALSDKMHSLGTYQGLTQTGTDIPARRYTFDAKFARGDMTVDMVLDASGNIIGYHVVPGAPH